MPIAQIQKASLQFSFHLMAAALALLLTDLVQAQIKNELQVRKILTVADFKGKPDETVDNLAKTNLVVSLTYSSGGGCSENGKIKLKVDTKISVRESSWMKSNKIYTPEILQALLSHEQGHYDLEAVFAIDLKKTLSAICFDKKNVRLQVDSTYMLMYNRYDSLQRRYDTETEYMRNNDMQVKWKQRIAAMLKTVR